MKRRPLRKTNEEFISQCKEVHNNKYDYNDSLYNGSAYPFTFKCTLHGEHTLKAGKHLSGQGCPKCGVDDTKEKMKEWRKEQFSTAEFIEKSKSIHEDKFNYSKAEYINTYTELIIICPFHGESLIEPRHHYKGTGCYKCGREKSGKSLTKKVELSDLVKQFKEIHGETFDYSHVTLDDYIGGLTKIKINCKSHGVFEQEIRGHLNGNGCNKCRYFGYTRTAYIENCIKRGHTSSEYYIVRFYNETEEFIKLGITTQGVKTRYRKIKERGYYNMDIVFKTQLPPDVAWDTERYYKSAMLEYKYQPANHFSGSTECFTMELPVEKIISEISV